MLAVVAVTTCSWALQAQRPNIANTLRCLPVRCDSDRCYYGDMDEHGNVRSLPKQQVQGDLAVEPNPLLSPAQMVDAQYAALAQDSDAGVKAAYGFISPKVIEQYNMDLAKFEGILASPAFDGLKGCSSWEVTGITDPIDDLCVVGIRVIPKPILGCVRTSGLADQGGITWPTFYKWTLRRQIDGPLAGCWMLDNMAPETPPIDVGVDDAQPQVSSTPRSRTIMARVNDVSMMAWSPPKNVDEAKTRLYGSIGEYNRLNMQEAAFCGEMIQSTSFALLSPDWEYTRVYALGFETLCGTLLEGSTEASAVRQGLCASFDWDPDVIKEDADAMRLLAEGKSEEELLSSDDLMVIAATNVKYTYTFGAGLVTLMQKAGLDPDTAIPIWCDRLNLDCVNAFSRDWQYYKKSVRKVAEMKEMFAQMKIASDKQAAARKEKANQASSNIE